MTHTEIVTRLCEMAAELEELKEKTTTPSDRFYLGHLSKEFQNTLNEMQEGGAK